jgi:hypothetical protein
MANSKDPLMTLMEEVKKNREDTRSVVASLNSFRADLKDELVSSSRQFKEIEAKTEEVRVEASEAKKLMTATAARTNTVEDSALKALAHAHKLELYIRGLKLSADTPEALMEAVKGLLEQVMGPAVKEVQVDLVEIRGRFRPDNPCILLAYFKDYGSVKRVLANQYKLQALKEREVYIDEWLPEPYREMKKMLLNVGRKILVEKIVPNPRDVSVSIRGDKIPQLSVHEVGSSLRGRWTWPELQFQKPEWAGWAQAPSTSRWA